MRVSLASAAVEKQQKPAAKKRGPKKGQPLPPPPSVILDGDVPTGDPDAPYRSKRFGRPSRLTQHVGDQILSSVSLGMDNEEAFLAAGIPASTFYEWLERGERETSSIFAEFAEDLKQARANGLRLTYAHLQKAAAGGNVQAIIFKLDRFFAQKHGITALWKAKAQEQIIGDLLERIRQGADSTTLATVAHCVLGKGDDASGDDRRVVDVEFDESVSRDTKR